MTATNIILDKGGVYETIIYTTSVSEEYNKKLTSFTPPVSSGKQEAGVIAKDTKIVDLLRVERKIIIKGYVSETDKLKLIDLYEKGGSTTWSFNSIDFDCNLEKLAIKTESRDKTGSGESDDLDVDITGLKGIPIG